MAMSRELISCFIFSLVASILVCTLLSIRLDLFDFYPDEFAVRPFGDLCFNYAEPPQSIQPSGRGERCAGPFFTEHLRVCYAGLQSSDCLIHGFA